MTLLCGIYTRLFTSLAAVALASVAAAIPSQVEHTPGQQAFGEPTDVTMREPETPRETELVRIFTRVSFQFTYDRVCIYYTTDGSEPSGSFGTPSGSTQVLTNTGGQVTFVRNESSGGTRDWWVATLPGSARAYGQNIKYKISAWQNFNGPEVFTNGANSANLANTFLYVNKLVWPGAGAGQGNPGAGYPPVSFWKEEAIFGNTYCAGQIDQNGTVYDFHFPTPGGVQGVGTRNEGYVDGVDTFPPGLPLGWRGQMHINQAMLGIRTPGDGITHWLSNPNGVSYTNIQQNYVSTSNTIITSQRLNASGNNISVQQADFAPLGITFPNDNAGAAQRHIYIKRLTLTNNTGSSQDVALYWYVDHALNGGDGYDDSFVDAPRSAMVAYDNTFRVVTGTGTGFTSPNEYNPTTSSGYTKDISLYLASAMKLLAPNGSVQSTATDFWRDTSADGDRGWMGMRVTLPPGVPVKVDVLMVGVDDRFAGAAGTYAFKAANVVDWFYNNDMGSVQASTDLYWTNWLNDGVTVSTPDPNYDAFMRRSLLATALHVDKVNGGVIAGFHNGAYPYVWPRDAVYAAVTLARTGHLSEAAGVYEWMKTTTYRDFEPWGRKGFWKQKYSTDGYVIWGAPQIDETAVFPWGLWYQYQLTGDSFFLSQYVDQVRDSVESMTRDSSDSRLRYEEAFNLVYSNNVWEDSYDTFIYSNANVIRGLWDAGSIFNALGLSSEGASATGKGNMIKSGLDARLDWNGENTDISQLGIVYPFNIYSATDARSARVIDRINGVALDAFGNNHPLVNFTGEHAGTINRYWGDGYWNGGPWFLSTAWYGLYYADRQHLTANTADIDNHKLRLDILKSKLGPTGLGAEQIAFSNSYLYPGQSDFTLQTAWPNAWESMSTFADGIMKFVEFAPNAPNNTMSFRPNLPSSWNDMTFNGIKMRVAPANVEHRVNLTVRRLADGAEHQFTNVTGNTLSLNTTLRVPANSTIARVTINGCPANYTYNSSLGTILVANFPAATGANAVTLVRAFLGCAADFNADASVDFFDYLDFVAAFSSNDCAADFNTDGTIDFFDYLDFVAAFSSPC